MKNQEKKSKSKGDKKYPPEPNRASIPQNKILLSHLNLPFLPLGGYFWICNFNFYQTFLDALGKKNITPMPNRVSFPKNKILKAYLWIKEAHKAGGGEMKATLTG